MTLPCLQPDSKQQLYSLIGIIFAISFLSSALKFKRAGADVSGHTQALQMSFAAMIPLLLDNAWSVFERGLKVFSSTTENANYLAIRWILLTSFLVPCISSVTSPLVWPDPENLIMFFGLISTSSISLSILDFDSNRLWYSHTILSLQSMMMILCSILSYALFIWSSASMADHWSLYFGSQVLEIMSCCLNVVMLVLTLTQRGSTANYATRASSMWHLFLLLSRNLVTLCIKWSLWNRPNRLPLLIYCQAAFVVSSCIFPRRHFCMVSLDIIQKIVDDKTSFMRYISHELRTPLNIIQLSLGYVDSETNRLVPDVGVSIAAAISEAVLDMSSSCDAAIAILDDLLTMDKMQSNKIVIDFENICAVEFFRCCFRQFRAIAEQNQIRFIFICDEPSLWVRLDRQKIGQVLRNLLSNAFKFTPASGSVTMQLSPGFLIDSVAGGGGGGYESGVARRGREVMSRASRGAVGVDDVLETNKSTCGFGHDALLIKIIDTGAGISKIDQMNLFGQYVQFNASVLQKGKGSGLGLWISKGLAELHGGSLTAASDGEGSGSTFTLALPLSTVEFPTQNHRLLQSPQRQREVVPAKADLESSTSFKDYVRGFLQPGRNSTSDAAVEDAYNGNVNGDGDGDGSSVGYGDGGGQSRRYSILSRAPVSAHSSCAGIAPRDSGGNSASSSIRANNPKDSSSRGNSSRGNSSRVNSSRVNSSRVDSSRVNSSRVNSSRVPNAVMNLAPSQRLSSTHNTPRNDILSSIETVRNGIGNSHFMQRPANAIGTSEMLGTSAIVMNGVSFNFLDSSQGSYTALPSYSVSPVTNSIGVGSAEVPTGVVPTVPTVPTVPQPMHYMLVDDSPANSKATKRLLVSAGHTVTTAESGSNCLEKMSSDDFDLLGRVSVVLMDNHMHGGLSGSELCGSLRSMGYKNLLVGLTDEVCHENVDRFMSQGCNYVIAKPLNIQDLNLIVNEWLHSADTFDNDFVISKRGVASVAHSFSVSSIVPASLQQTEHMQTSSHYGLDNSGHSTTIRVSPYAPARELDTPSANDADVNHPSDTGIGVKPTTCIPQQFTVSSANDADVKHPSDTSIGAKPTTCIPQQFTVSSANDADVKHPSDTSIGAKPTTCIPQQVTVSSANRRRHLHKAAGGGGLQEGWARSYHFLLVDDAPTNRKVMRRLLSMEGHIISEATDGIDFLKTMESSFEKRDSRGSYRELGCEQKPVSEYDVVLMDHLMPRMNGSEASRKIRDRGYKGLIIGLTGHTLSSDVEFFISNGVDHVLFKPLNLTLLKKIVADHFQGKT